MLLISRALLVAVLPAVVAFSGQPPEWKVYDYPAHGFSVSLPAPPTVKKDDLLGGARYSAALEDAVFTVDVTEVGENIDKQAGPEGLLRAGRDGFVKRLTGCKVQETKVTRPGASEIELAAQCADANVLSRLLIAGRTFYQVVVFSKPGYPDARRFIESFKLVSARDTAEAPAPASGAPREDQ